MILSLILGCSELFIWLLNFIITKFNYSLNKSEIEANVCQNTTGKENYGGSALSILLVINDQHQLKNVETVFLKMHAL